EVRILRTGAVIGEVQGLLDERVQIGSLPVVAAATRVLQHAPDNAVGAAAVLDDLLQISGQHSNCLDNLVALAGIEGADRAGCFLQLVQQFDREAGKIIDEIEGVLDLVRDAGRHLPERRHLLRMDQARLRRLQFAQGRFSGVFGGTDGLLRSFALRDIAVDEHKATARHRIATYLKGAAIGSYTFVAQLQPGVVYGAAELSLEIG